MTNRLFFDQHPPAQFDQAVVRRDEASLLALYAAVP